MSFVSHATRPHAQKAEILTPPSPGLFVTFSSHPEKGRFFCGFAKDLCISFFRQSVKCRMHRSFTPRPPRPAKEAGRRKAAGALFRMTDMVVNNAILSQAHAWSRQAGIFPPALRAIPVKQEQQAAGQEITVHRMCIGSLPNRPLADCFVGREPKAASRPLLLLACSL